MKTALLPYQQRVVNEYKELADRLSKLNAFIASETFSTLEGIDQDLLEVQSNHMGSLSCVLQRRIDRFNNTKVYISHKKVKATPMNRQAYNNLRGWAPLTNENGADEGYLVEYMVGGQANHPDYANYISWSPKDVFERGYKEAPFL